MIQFTQKEIEHLRKKKNECPQAILRLEEEVKDILEEPLLIPKTGIGNWSLYYYCPDCSVKLDFNRHSPKAHRCPVCGKIWTGSPYYESWWWIVSMENYEAAFRMALLYQIAERKDCADKAIEMMLAYASYYKDYEVHGDIPYNGPGKAGAQTLDEANFLRSFALTYDLLESCMSTQEKEKIRDGLLLPGAEFLMEHRHMQLHNHEVIINSAIAIIGLIFGKEELVKEAVYEKYGLLYQLEHGMLSNHMWFEGAFGYHFYALTSFFAYEKFALHTPHSHIHHPNYKAMMELLFSYIEPGFRVPMLNDTNYGHTSSIYYLYEFAYREIGGDKLLYVLKELYKDEARDNLEAFIYGVDILPTCDIVPTGNHIEEGSGNSILRGKDERYLLFKHDCYGGEHDHYDRLDISYEAFGKRIAPDLGTTGYGALMHYDYYKNTGSHNTVNIEGNNQAPANGVLIKWEENDGIVCLEAKADWTAPYKMPDSFTIVQWDEDAYRTVTMKRTILWAQEWFAEVFFVDGIPQGKTADWVMHFSGSVVSEPIGKEVVSFSDKKPYKHLHSMIQLQTETTKENEKNVVQTIYRDDDVLTWVYGMDNGQNVFVGKGPDNPSISDINYRIERANGPKAVFAHVIASASEKQIQTYQKDTICPIEKVTFEQHEDGVTICVVQADGKKIERIITN